MAKTSIEWCDITLNPVTGCNKVSQGCKHCYAETIAERFWATQYPPNADGSPRKFTDVRLHPERLEEPLKWKKPRRVFVNSMSDLFHESVSGEFIGSVFKTMHLAYRHTFMILTKRPEHMQTWVNYFYGHYKRLPLPNVWLGVSVEDQETADKRIPRLLQTTAAVRFVSYEPALGPVDFQGWDGELMRDYLRHTPGEDTSRRGPLDWIIMGGESGPGARPMHPDWARNVRDQCQAAGVPFFFKQWGEWMPWIPRGGNPSSLPIQHVRLDGKPYKPGDYSSSLQSMIRVSKKAAGRLLDGREWNEFPVQS